MNTDHADSEQSDRADAKSAAFDMENDLNHVSNLAWAIYRIAGSFPLMTIIAYRLKPCP
jgi:hypothetical protein